MSKAVFARLWSLAAVLFAGGCNLMEPETPPAPPAPLAVIQMSDPQLGFSKEPGADLERLKQAVRSINALNPAPAAVVVCGDLVNTPTDASWREFRETMTELKVPWYCAPGNHDIGGGEGQADARTRFLAAIGPDYQSVKLGGFRFLLVNTQLWQQEPNAATEEMNRWFDAELIKAQAADEPVVVVGHVPLFVGNVDEPDEYFNIPRVRRLELLDRFQRNGVVAMLTGHTHTAFTTLYDGILFSSAENTSAQFDRLAPGFRMIEFTNGAIRVRTMPLVTP